MKTPMDTAKSIKRAWHLIDLDGKTLGRISTQIALFLMGKTKTSYTPHIDNGDYVVAINAAKVKVTGKKTTDKIYRHHTGFPSGFREYTYNQVMAKDPKKIIMLSVKGMLPKNRLRADRLKRLKIFVNANHPYADQLSAKKDV